MDTAAVSADPRRRALQKLAVRFKSGASPDRLAAALEDVNGWHIETVDLAEGVERMISAREVNTYPQGAEIRRHAMAARSTRLLDGKPADGPESRGRPMNAAELAHSRDIMLLYRARLIWCVTCHGYGPYCAKHDGDPGREANARQSADAVTALPAGAVDAVKAAKEQRRRLPQKPSTKVQEGIDYVIEQRREREGAPDSDTALGSMTPLGDEIADELELF